MKTELYLEYMQMDPTNVILSEIIKTLFKASTRIKLFEGTTEKDASERIFNHLQFVESWSAMLHSLGMSKPLSVENSTVKLSIRDVPRILRGLNDKKLLVETDLLSNTDNYVILGDPGSGKTTTVQRICCHLLSDNIDDRDIYSYPIVVLLRNLKINGSVILEIGSIIGVTLPRMEYESNNRATVPKEFKINIYEFLNSTKAVVFLDGIDEINPSFRLDLEGELKELACHSKNFKVIATCRSGDYARTLNGYCIVEIAPLEKNQIKQIVNLLANRPSAFMKALKDSTYHDTVDRPLFLTQIIQIYNQIEALPQKPSDVYRRIVTLILERWDADRNITRKSAYSNFGVDQKREFLSSFSFHLTYKLRQKTFSEQDLIATYDTIAHQFQLPIRDARQVVQEIESHNGLVVKSSFDNYEFCHLSLQEYLAADYILRSPQTLETKMYLQYYPAPLAVAIALSSNPSDWLWSLLLKPYRGGEYFEITSDIFESLVSRINLEKPNFSTSRMFGMALLKMISLLLQKVDSWSLSMQKFMLSEISLRSISLAVPSFYVHSRMENERGFLLLWGKDTKFDRYHTMPDELQIDRKLLHLASNINNPRMVICEKCNNFTIDKLYDRVIPNNTDKSEEIYLSMI